MSHAYSFPPQFIWGCATAAYQVEGAASSGGRKPSIWDTFSQVPGNVLQDHHGDVAVDQYHLYPNDIAHMKWLGLKAYRMSLSWSRVIPDGTGQVNQEGMDHYDRVVDALLEAGIEPWITLFHWDLPQALEDRFGGWTSREIIPAFGDYAAEISRRLSDRVKNFFTINEFICFIDFGYESAQAAPGKKLGIKVRNQARHHALVAHGTAVQALRAHAHGSIRVGLAENSTIPVPLIETQDNILACRKAMRRINAHYLTAVMEGAYMDEYLRDEGINAPVVEQGDMALAGQPLDFVGLNMYLPTYVQADAANPEGYSVVPDPVSYPKMNMPWLLIGPQVLYWGPRHLKDIWNVKSIVVSENGCSSEDRIAPDGRIYDTDRVMYLRNHLIAASRAVADGIPLHGYFLWSLLDNFEWLWGYTKRFGIIYVNYSNLERTPKESARFYRETIARNIVA